MREAPKHPLALRSFPTLSNLTSFTIQKHKKELQSILSKTKLPQELSEYLQSPLFGWWKKIYAIGGYPLLFYPTLLLSFIYYSIGNLNGYTSLNSMEMYDPVFDLWIDQPRMSVARSDTVAATLHGKIFVVGGNDGWDSLNSIEIFSPQSSKWQFGRNMSHGRERCSCVSLRDKIYAIGGFSFGR